jgi:hypothetical protein
MDGLMLAWNLGSRRLKLEAVLMQEITIGLTCMDTID